MSSATVAALILLIVCVVLSFLLVVSLTYLFRFAKIIFYVEDAIEESLDVLDASFTDLYKISEKEVFFDSPEIQTAVASIKNSRDAVLYVASALASIDNSTFDDSGEEEETT